MFTYYVEVRENGTCLLISSVLNGLDRIGILAIWSRLDLDSIRRQKKLSRDLVTLFNFRSDRIDRKVKNRFLRLSRELLNRFWRSFFKMTRATRSTKQKKDHWNRITRSRDNFFCLRIESESSPDRITKIPIRFDPCRTIVDSSNLMQVNCN